MNLSPLAPSAFPELPPVPGVRLATLAAGLRYMNRADLMLAEVVEGTSVAGAFTQSSCPSAPVDWCRAIIGRGQARAVVCNAGNANAFTGQRGQTAARISAEVVAAQIGCDPEEVYLASTGVIGEPMDMEAMANALPRLVGQPGASWEEAAQAIMTTDTYPKGSFSPVEGSKGVVVGIAKGSGMIAPDMATMLGFVFTDLAVTPEALQIMVSASVQASYNRVTVDSDTSTSDTVLFLATGASVGWGGGKEPISGPDSDGWNELEEALNRVNLDLAHQIVKDGEGATKFVEVAVSGAEHDRAAVQIARSIANSPLVKTAIAAEDANWGRIVMAVGKSGERADRDQLMIKIGDELVAHNGWKSEQYCEARATEIMQQPEYVISVDVGVGKGRASVWTCDLGHGYIEINAGYRS